MNNLSTLKIIISTTIIYTAAMTFVFALLTSGKESEYEFYQERLKAYKKQKLKVFRDLERWFIDKGLHRADPRAQFKKLLEEVNEAEEALASGDIEHIQEELTDIVIVVQGLYLQHNLDFMQSLQLGYDKIKDRKGAVIGDTFVKEADLIKTQATPKNDMEVRA